MARQSGNARMATSQSLSVLLAQIIDSAQGRPNVSRKGFDVFANRSLNNLELGWQLSARDLSESFGNLFDQSWSFPRQGRDEHRNHFPELLLGINGRQVKAKQTGLLNLCWRKAKRFS